MRLKTFLATYLLFLCILFSSLSIVSAHMTSSQIDLLKEKSQGEYQTIAASFARDIVVLYGGNADIRESLHSLTNGYARYYRDYNISVVLTDLSLLGHGSESRTRNEILFYNQEREHFITITGTLSEPFDFYLLEYSLNITNNVEDMQNIQNTLLLFAVIFSVVTALGLYFIVSSIFKPLGIVANVSGKIADGQYSERIHIKGKNELSSMALNFNRMAEKIENQIHHLEEEAEKKQQFIDNFAHEIRTPLTSVYGYAEYIQKASLNEEEIIESAQSIMDEAGHMSKIANSLLELATLRNYAPMKYQISIPRLFNDISQYMENALYKNNVQLICHSIDGTLYGQEDLVKSLLMNLCINAMKACSPNVGIIHISAEKQDERIIISVVDNGCGIPEESIANITEPFYRVDRARSREQGGAGLGLTLCKQIAEAHNAEMIFESAMGTGTTVRITFTSS